MKIDIVVVYQKRYRQGHEYNFVPPITGIHLAAITPKKHQVRVIHQQVDPIPEDTDADLIALSFFSGFAPEAYRLARMLKQKGKIVVAGGPHATFFPDEALSCCDAVVIGEAESVWETVLSDAENRVLRPTYRGESVSLDAIPTPRYDLLSPSFFIKRVVQATRGCPFSCSFCSVPSVNPGFRMRPVENVIEDIRYDDFPRWWQRKIVWFWDDNLTANRPYIKELLNKIVPFRRWWLTQASMDIAKDLELIGLMKKSGCIGVFFGIETFTRDSLLDANKKQNKIDYYKECIRTMHDHGIAVMAGFIAGFDGDTPESIVEMADRLYEIGVDVPFISVLTPYKGTPLYERLQEEGRLLPDRGWECYNGYNITFSPRNMGPEDLLRAHRSLWKKTFSWGHVIRRLAKSIFYLRIGAFLLSFAMNGFYGYKALRRNSPLNMPETPGLRP